MRVLAAVALLSPLLFSADAESVDALLLLSRGDKAEHRSHLQSVIQATPNDYEARLYLGKFCWTTGSTHRL